MSGLDVEALLDATAKTSADSKPKPTDGEDRANGERPERKERDRPREGSRDRDRDHDRRRRDRDRRERSSTRSRRGTPDDYKASTPRSDAGSHKKEMAISTEEDGGTPVPVPAHPTALTARRATTGTIASAAIAPTVTLATTVAPEMTTVKRLPSQLAARLRTRDLKTFFEKVGPVNEAQIVKDRISQRSKGVEAASAETPGAHPNSIPFHRLYVGNIHFNVTEQDLQAVFEPFGELEFVQLQKDDNGRSRGYGFVQYREASQAREALEKMNGFDLAGRPIRVGLGNDKFTPESTANMLQRFPGQNPVYQGSAFSGAGGRGPQTSAFDRAGGRDSEKSGGASALDDTDVAGVNFNNYSRDALMRKLARTDEPSNGVDERQVLKPKTETKPLPVNVNMASRCVVLHNMFDPEEEEGDDWVKELEDDVRQEAESKYGRVVHISVDPNSKGDIYLKFDKVQGGENAIRGLNGRYFGGRMIDASPVVDAVYSRYRNAHVPLTRSIQARG
ncbi:RNA-binding protein rsd1 [Colletotrichum orbiculare MAFF 240422]|uniref:RNA-binding protein rsd1 n=1 Tax=Colletotrichum orbiculare (strain 104-T / ATCC 96160 / CBS 514.97 / LARS 414 / MAFF 240422) TaxID=1213857 RepID=A0A484FC30_COLOR|nr:RNA-binding protein rsd1 [Colletotrichum orbiculare MAFF 240422]